MKQAIRFKLFGCTILSSSQKLSLLIFKMEMMLRGEVSIYSIWALWDGPLEKWLWGQGLNLEEPATRSMEMLSKVKVQRV